METKKDIKNSGKVWETDFCGRKYRFERYITSPKGNQFCVYEDNELIGFASFWEVIEMVKKKQKKSKSGGKK